MKKQIIFEYFKNDAQDLADKLEFAHRNTYYNWPDILTDRILADVLRRMKAARLKIPADWK
jgi:hypothetical protein